MARSRLLLLAVASILLLATPAGADECVTTTSSPAIVLGSFYVDNDPCQFSCLFSIWIYQESNDIEGLQRWVEVKDDTCGGRIEPDTWAS